MEAFRRRGTSILANRVVSVSSRIARASYWLAQDGHTGAFITKVSRRPAPPPSHGWLLYRR